MELSLTLVNSVALFSVMVALAIVPDSSTITVAARALASGIRSASLVIVGIAVGDYVFIVIAIYGLANLAGWMGTFFVILKYMGGAYLIVLGSLLWKSNATHVDLKEIKGRSWASDFMTGFLITMGDPKAILFYMSLLSAFIDMVKATVLDVIYIMVMVTIVLFGVKLGYAYMAVRTKVFLKSSVAEKRINMFSGSVMMATGLYLILKV